MKRISNLADRKVQLYTYPKIERRMAGRAPSDNSFNRSSRVLLTSIFPPEPATRTPPALDKSLVPIYGKEILTPNLHVGGKEVLLINFNGDRFSRLVFEVLGNITRNFLDQGNIGFLSTNNYCRFHQCKSTLARSSAKQ